MSKIYLDMDGVLANFDAYTIKHIGSRLRDFSNSKAGWDAIAHIKDDIYANLDPMPDADELVSSVLSMAKEHGYTVGVLTAIPKLGRVAKAEQHKREWLAKYYPDLLEGFNIGPYAVDKQNHCRASDVLIDDSDKNIPQWNDAGGYGILHTSARDSLYYLALYLKTPD